MNSEWKSENNTDWQKTVQTELTKIEQQLARGSSEFKSSGSTTQVTFLNPESQNSPDDPILM